MVCAMMKDTFFQWLLDTFTLNKRRDYILKPLAVLLTFLVMFTSVAVLVPGQDPSTLPGAILTAAVVQMPFTTVAFALLNYTDRMQRQLADLAMTDVLTGLPNRRAFVARAALAQTRGELGFVMIIDADHFKRINDSYGHAVGDRCLQAIAKRLNDVLRPEDIIGRIGGEEFGAFMPFCTMEEIDLIGERLCGAILINLPEVRDPVRLTLSVGAAETQPYELIESALSRADAALYAAKAGGRARLVVWTRSVMDRVA